MTQGRRPDTVSSNVDTEDGPRLRLRHWLLCAVKRPARAIWDCWSGCGQNPPFHCRIKGTYSRTPHVHAILIPFRELKLDHAISVWPGFGMHVLTNVSRQREKPPGTVCPAAWGGLVTAIPTSEHRRCLPSGSSYFHLRQGLAGCRCRMWSCRVSWR